MSRLEFPTKLKFASFALFLLILLFFTTRSLIVAVDLEYFSYISYGKVETKVKNDDGTYNVHISYLDINGVRHTKVLDLLKNKAAEIVSSDSIKVKSRISNPRSSKVIGYQKRPFLLFIIFAEVILILLIYRAVLGLRGKIRFDEFYDKGDSVK